MYTIRLKNDKEFTCDTNTSIFEAAKSSGVFLEHSCLTARCRSCVVKVLEGETKDKTEDLVLTKEEKAYNFTLSCNAVPASDLVLDVEDLGDIILYDKQIVPAKINSLEQLTKDVINVKLRLPPTAKFKYNSGQYVNLIKGNIKRSYSVANAYKDKATLEFFIKKYEKGLMSNYFLNEAKENDLLRMEGPLGSFFLRETNKENIVFLATGTGIAPVKAILEHVKNTSKNLENKTFWLFLGARYKEDVFWTPKELNISNLKFIKSLSRETSVFEGHKGYVQEAVLKEDIDLTNAQVYACGSNEMIKSAKSILIQNKLSENDFFSDAFICTN